MDLEAVGGEEGLAAALLVAHEGVLAAVRLLVRAQVPRRAVGPGAAFEHALVALHLEGGAATPQGSGSDKPLDNFPGYQKTSRAMDQLNDNKCLTIQFH